MPSEDLVGFGVMPRRPRRLVVVALALALLSLLAACGDSSDEPAAAPPVEHIHGVGVNPRDDSLLIATHAGLFRSPADSTSAERVGDRQQDTMGFTVVGPDRLLGSGHPDLRDDLPSSLGLIRSADAGRSWASVSLLGRADLHVIRAARFEVYAYDAASGRFLASGDQGRTWRLSTTGSEVIDIAVDPRDARHVVISTPNGLRRSRDGGATWRALPADAPGLLLWTDALRHIDAQGIVIASPDAGRSWHSIGSVGGRPVATAASGRDLYVATEDNKVLVSSDGGRSWRTRFTGGSGQAA